VIAIAIAGAFNTIWDVVAAPSAGIWSIAKSYLASLVGVLALGLHAVDVTGAPRDSNRSQSAIEPVSVRSANSCRETVWRGQRPRRHFWRRLHILRDRDWPLSRLRRQSPGKLKTIPTAAGKAGRTRTSKQ